MVGTKEIVRAETQRRREALPSVAAGEITEIRAQRSGAARPSGTISLRLCVSARNNRCTRHHHASGLAVKPARSSRARAALRTPCSSRALPTSWRPRGRPSALRPAGTAIARGAAGVGGGGETGVQENPDRAVCLFPHAKGGGRGGGGGGEGGRCPT